jgi:hypothetical protein
VQAKVEVIQTHENEHFSNIGQLKPDRKYKSLKLGNDQATNLPL